MKKSDSDSDITYSIEEYLKTSGQSANFFDWELYDGNGNPIEDEEMFDNTVKYNII